MGRLPDELVPECAIFICELNQNSEVYCDKI
jgi:hypothetical protein